MLLTKISVALFAATVAPVDARLGQVGTDIGAAIAAFAVDISNTLTSSSASSSSANAIMNASSTIQYEHSRSVHKDDSTSLIAPAPVTNEDDEIIFCHSHRADKCPAEQPQNGGKCLSSSSRCSDRRCFYQTSCCANQESITSCFCENGQWTCEVVQDSCSSCIGKNKKNKKGKHSISRNRQRKLNTKCMEMEDLPGFEFFFHEDSTGGDYDQLDGKDYKELAQACIQNEECLGFNTKGNLKDTIKPYRDWEFAQGEGCAGLFVRTVFCQTKQLEGYTLVQKKDSPGNNLVHLKEHERDFKTLAEKCTNTYNCAGFNTGGILKTTIQEDLSAFDYGTQRCDGTYIRKFEDCPFEDELDGYMFYAQMDSKGNNIVRAPMCEGEKYHDLETPLVQVDASHWDKAVGVTASGVMRYYNGDTWVSLKGTFKHASIGKLGTLWGVSNENVVFRRTSVAANEWIQLNKKMVQVDAHDIDEAVGVDPASKAWYYNGQGWIDLNIGNIKMISMGSKDRSAWAVDMENNVWRRKDVTDKSATWSRVDGSLTTIDALSIDHAIGVGSNGKLYFYNKDAWVVITGSAQSISVGLDGSVFAVRPKGSTVFRRRFALCTKNNKITGIAHACNNDLNCEGFTSDGWLKKTIIEETKFTVLPNLVGCGGLFVKDTPECPDQENLPGFSFYPNMDSSYGDRRMIPEARGNIALLSKACLDDIYCEGFNSIGYLKSSIKDDTDWNFSSDYKQKCEGLFVKETDDCPTQENVPGFTFYQSMDSIGNTKKTIADKRGDTDALRQACMDDFYCAGFNSVGHLKSAVLPEDKLTHWSGYKSCEGFFVKEYDDCPKQDSLPGFMFFVNMDDPGDDIRVISEERGNFEALGKACLDDINCVGFNSAGHLKSNIGAEKDFVNGKGFKSCEGLFVKDTPDCPEQEELVGYDFYPGMDSAGDDIRTDASLAGDFAALADDCTRNVNCGAFNSFGTLKSDTLEENEWKFNPKYPKCGGLFVKTEADCTKHQVKGFTLYPKFDSMSHNIKRVYGSVQEMAALCKANGNCEGFNSGGQLKHTVRSDEEWRFRRDFSACQGLYVMD